MEVNSEINESTIERIEVTFSEMGLRSQKNIAVRLLQENAQESNLIPDISSVDYLDGNEGQTVLATCPELGLFVDDIYVYGYMGDRDVARVKGTIHLTTGESGAAAYIVDHIRGNAHRTLGRKISRYIHTKILSTVHMHSTNQIGVNVRAIEKNDNNSRLAKWKELNRENPVGIFLAKLDVSEISIQDLEEELPNFSRMLENEGYGIYSIDYTRDCIGTLDRQAVVDFLVREKSFCVQGEEGDDEEPKIATILDNTKKVGNHVLTYVSRWKEHNIRVKLYNKLVCQFESGEVTDAFGGHLASYADCENRYLRKLWENTSVKTSGVTRVEVSLYGMKNIDRKIGGSLVEDVLGLVQDEPLFVIQPCLNQWKRLSSELDRCCVLADVPGKTIYVAWFANTRTGKVAGVRVAPGQKCQSGQKWDKAVSWACSEFGFRSCPIFQFSILSTNELGIEISPLACYMKTPDSKTVLCSSKRPCQLRPNNTSVEHLQEVLPETQNVSWEWRTKKCHSVGIEKLRYSLECVSDILDGRVVSHLSTRNRAMRNVELLDDRNVELWRARIFRDTMEKRERRRGELEYLTLKTNEIRMVQLDDERVFEIVRECVHYRGLKLSQIVEECPVVLTILGYKLRNFGYGEVYMIVYSINDIECHQCVYGNKAIGRILDQLQSYFKERDGIYFLPQCLVGHIQIEVHLGKSFVKNGALIHWHPVRVLKAPSGGVDETFEDQKKCLEEIGRCTVQKCECPSSKEMRKALEMEEGEYNCIGYHHQVFRRKKRTILFLENSMDRDVHPVYGYWMQREVEKMNVRLEDIVLPLPVRLGILKTTPQKVKDRRVQILVGPQN